MILIISLYLKIYFYSFKENRLENVPYESDSNAPKLIDQTKNVYKEITQDKNQIENEESKLENLDISIDIESTSNEKESNETPATFLQLMRSYFGWKSVFLTGLVTIATVVVIYNRGKASKSTKKKFK